MKKLATILSVLFITGCASTSATQTATDSAQLTLESIKEKTAALEQSLPETCLTNEILTQFRYIDADINILQAQIDTINATSGAEISAEQADKKRWQAYLIGALLVAAGLGYLLIRK